VQLHTVWDINFDENQSLKHVLLPAALSINCLFQTVISCLQIKKSALAFQVCHGTGNTCRQISVHTYCISFHTLLKEKKSYKLKTVQTFKLYRFCGFHSYAELANAERCSNASTLLRNMDWMFCEA
jgi:hypothetical protein